MTAVDDGASEGPHTSTIAHTTSSADGNFNGLTVSDVTANVEDNDLPAVLVVESGGSTSVSEAGTTSDTFTVVLQSPPTGPVSITVDPDVQTDVGSGAGIAIVLVFTGGNWNTAQVVLVTAVDDDIAEGNHNSTIVTQSTSGDMSYNGISVSDVVATVTDDDSVGVDITESGGSTTVNETGATSDTYTIVLTSEPVANVTITVDPDTQTDVGAGSGATINLTFTSGDWNVAQTVVVTAIDDAISEGPHTSSILHTAASGDSNYNGVAIATVTVNVIDNDAPGVTVSESGASTDVDETGPTSDTYTIVLDSQPTTSVTITIDPDLQTDAGAGAGATVDLTFTNANWNTPQTATVTAVDDAIDEGSHTSTITHAAASADADYQGIGIGSVTANVTDNDTAGVTITESGGSSDASETGPTSDTYTIVLDSQPTASVTMTIDPDLQTDVGAGDGATVDLTFTNANWNTPQTVTVTAVDDAIDEGSHTSTITHTTASTDGNYNGITAASVTVNVADNDTAGVTVTESGGSSDVSETGPTSDTYTIVLTSQPTANVTITADPDVQSDVGAGAGATTNLTFTSGNWSTPQTVTVTAVDDSVDENAHTSTITHAAVSADGNYQGISIGTVTANVADNDTAGVTVTESGGTTDVDEAGPTSDTYTIVLSTQPTATVTVIVDPDVQTDVGAGADATVSLTFTSVNWGTPQTVTVTAVDDAVDENAHTSTIAHSATSADGKYQGISIGSVTANLTDNDTAGVTITESGGSSDVSETGPTSDTYTIVLTSQPATNVTITVDPDTQTDVGGGTGGTIDLTFTSANWNTSQTVTITGVVDGAAEGPHTSTIVHTAVSADPLFNGVSIASLTVNVTDEAGLTITETGGVTEVDESGPTSDSYTLVLNDAPSADVTIIVDPTSQIDVGAGSGVALLLTFTPANWNSFQSINVTAVDDAVFEGTQTSFITHQTISVDARYDGLNIASLLVTITDNDTQSSGGGGGGGGGSIGPVARDATVTTDEDTAVEFDLPSPSFASSDPTFHIIAHPLQGTITGQPPKIIYTPGTNYFGPDAFTYIVALGDTASNIAEVMLNVLPVNDPPYGVQQTLELEASVSLSITLLGFDTEAGTDVIFEIVRRPSHGQILGFPPLLRYIPEADFLGVDEFTYTVNDGELSSDPVLITLRVGASDGSAESPTGGGDLDGDVNGGSNGDSVDAGTLNGTRRCGAGLCGALDGVTLALSMVGYISLRRRR